MLPGRWMDGRDFGRIMDDLCVSEKNTKKQNKTYISVFLEGWICLLHACGLKVVGGHISLAYIHQESNMGSHDCAFYSFACSFSNCTSLVHFPTPSSSTSTTSPSLSHSGGLRLIPTPCGLSSKRTRLALL